MADVELVKVEFFIIEEPHDRLRLIRKQSIDEYLVLKSDAAVNIDGQWLIRARIKNEYYTIHSGYTSEECLQWLYSKI